MLQFDRDAIVLDTGKHFMHRRQTFTNLHLGSIVLKIYFIRVLHSVWTKALPKNYKIQHNHEKFGVFFISRWLSDCMKLTVIDSQTNSNYRLLRNKIFTEKNLADLKPRIDSYWGNLFFMSSIKCGKFSTCPKSWQK